MGGYYPCRQAGVMASSSTARSRRHRQRVSAKKRVFWAEVNVEEIREVLVVGGLLQQWDQENHKAINAAFQRAVSLWVGRELAKLRSSGQL
jgi:hypothetical protein